MAILPFFGLTMKPRNLVKVINSFSNTDKMPVLFLGHGSPMNAIEENEFVSGFREVRKEINTPNAILCISAHWETNGTFVTAMHHFPSKATSCQAKVSVANSSNQRAGEFWRLFLWPRNFFFGMI